RVTIPSAAVSRTARNSSSETSRRRSSASSRLMLGNGIGSLALFATSGLATGLTAGAGISLGCGWGIVKVSWVAGPLRHAIDVAVNANRADLPYQHATVASTATLPPE